MKEIVPKYQEDIEGHQAEVTIMEEDITIKIVVEDQDTIIRGDIVAAAVAEGVEVVVVEIDPEEERDIAEVVRVVMEKEEMVNIVVVVEEVVVVKEVEVVIIMIVEEVIVEVEVVVMREIKKEKKEEVKKMIIILKQ